MDHAAVMNSCDEKAQRVGLATVTKIERVVVLVSRANFEIELGGFSAFFYNSAGDYAADTVSALEAVGAVRASAALRAAMAKFPGGTPPTERELRYGWHEALGSLGEFDSEFYEEKPDVFSRLCTFIEAHAAELSEHACEAEPDAPADGGRHPASS
jgi:hypothetical protein